MINQILLTKNNCYKSGKLHFPQGMMYHSTGANNPNLGRYVPNYDGNLSANKYNNHWDTPTPGGRSVCVHGFIGLDRFGNVKFYQTLPWNMVGWHSGKGSKGSANTMGILGIEICEDALNNEKYFRECITLMNQITAYLADMFGWEINSNTVFSHSEGWRRGIASNHGDIEHWSRRFGYTMDDARREVREIMAGNVNKALTDLKEARKLIDGAISELGSTGTKPTPPTPSTFKVGDRVRVKTSATKYATGQNIANFVKGSTYTIQQLQADRALLSSIMSWVLLKDLEK